MTKEIRNKYYISYSGGIGSFITAHRLKQLVPEKSIELVFCDTLIEDGDLYRFLDESAKKLDLPLTKIKDGRNPWQVFADVKYQGNSRTAHCSKVLKRDVFNKFLEKRKKEKPKENIIIVLGFDYTEIERLPRAKENNKEYEVIAPLCEKPYLSQQHKLDILKDYNIKIPKLYKLGFAHNNCGGFCVRGGLAHFKLLKNTLPETFEWHKNQQKALTTLFPELDRPFLRKMINKKLTYITLAQFENIELEKEEEFDFGGCGCFVDV